jgi:hypothetical protein
VNPSPRVKARLAGALYLASAVPAGFSVYVITKLVARGDPAATAANILGSETLFRIGCVADLVGIILFLGSVIWLYELFRPASRSLSLLMVLFALLGCTLQAVDALGDSAALLLLKGGPPLAAFTTAQLQDLAFLCLRLHTLLYTLALMFFGVYSMLMATLILRSTFLPRVLGVLMVIDGLGYLTFSVSVFLSPPFAARLYPLLPFATAVLGEASLMLWLIVKAVNAERWDAHALAAAASTR